jgi:hypothetical protein
VLIAVARLFAKYALGITLMLHGPGKALATYVGVTILSLIILALVIQLWRADMAIPFSYSGGDEILHSALTKAVLDNRWYLHNRFLGMPTGLDLYDFPVGDNFHLLWMKLLSFLLLNYSITFNVYFIITFLLAVLTSLYVLRQFNISTLPAVVGSVLFAFLPYHFFRGQGHFFLGAYYLVPLMMMVILWICMGDLSSYGRLVSKKIFTSILICIVVGSEIPYYAFFSGFLLLVSGIYSTFRQISLKSLIITVILSIVLFLTVVVNTLPTLMYSYRYGKNNVHERSPGESEIYGLKIVQLLLPISGHRIASWARFKEAYNSHAPLINENDTASLGTIGGLGFLVLIGWPLYARRDSWNAELFRSLSTLNIAAVLLATVGGFGSMFALLISPQFRSINRVSVYIAFLSLFAVVLLLEKLAQTRWVQSKSRLRLFYGLLGLILVIGILDQTSRGFVPPYRQVKAMYQSDAAFIKQVEASVPENAMIFQLPYIPFPESAAVGRVGGYDHFRAYLHSDTLRWSFGAMRNRDGDVWQRHVLVKPLPALVETVAAAGFSGIYLDRYGYADRGAGLEAQLAELLTITPMVSPDQRLAFFNFNRYRTKPEIAQSMEDTNATSSDLMVVGDWTSLPERKGKSSGLAAAVVDEKLNVLVRGTDKQIYHTQMAAGGWTSWTSLGGAARYGPATVEFMGDLWVFMGGTARGIYANRMSNRTWSGWSEISGPVRTVSEPAAVAFERALYVFHQSANERIYVTRFDGGQWSGWSEVPGGGLTSSAPVAAPFGDALYLLIREMNNRIYVNRFDGRLWSGWRMVSTDGPAAIKPGMAASSSSLSLIVQTLDKRLSLGQLPVAPHLPND